MGSLAESVDAFIGVDTHRDTHEAEIADANGTPIATVQIRNDSAGFATLLTWIAEHAPGPRIVVSVEGTRSYGVGLARALGAAGVTVLECEQPARSHRRGRGKSDPIDAHLAVLAALRMDATRLPAMRADGDREALRILLGARQDLVVSSTAQTNRLRALLLSGGDGERQSARGPLTAAALAGLLRTTDQETGNVHLQHRQRTQRDHGVAGQRPDYAQRRRPGGVDPRRRGPGDRQSADTDGREPEHHEPHGQPHRSQPGDRPERANLPSPRPHPGTPGDPQCASCTPDTGRSRCHTVDSAAGAAAAALSTPDC